MATTRLAYPRCRVAISSSKVMPEGTKITSVNCRQSFLDPAVPATAAVPQVQTHDPDLEFVDVLDAPIMTVPRRRKRWKGLIVAMCLMVLAGGGAALTSYFYLVDLDTAPGAHIPIAATVPTPPTPKLSDSRPFRVKKMQTETIKSDSFTEAIPQSKIDDAVRKGTRFLKSAVEVSANWIEQGAENEVGYAALPGLALLESGVAANDPVIQKAAAFVRRHSAQLADTYDLGLAVVFLNRLGEVGDKELIRTLALRLVAGQSPAGGWGYKCPILETPDSEQLLSFLKANRPKLELFDLLEKLPDNRQPKKMPATAMPRAAQRLSPRLQELPIVVYQKKQSFEAAGRDDNSNTQFGLLGLWAARNHGVPVELSLSLATMRFQKTQSPDGGWGYVIQAPAKNTMTCVGLLGLAMGHGSITEALAAEVAKGGLPKPPGEDPHIKLALEALTLYVEPDDSRRGLESRIDLYYLWALERVGMLYRQKTFGKKDWYRWGTKIILANQRPDGGWQMHYDPPIDTSFALLFLRRANWVSDLTERLPLYLDIPNRQSLEERQEEERSP